MTTSLSNINYKIKTSTEEEILAHLKECNEDFIPPLDQRVNLQTYSKKIADRAVTFEAWTDRALIGLLAAYWSDEGDRSGFVTNVSIVRNYRRLGIASQLMDRCIRYANAHRGKEIRLEIHKDNLPTILWYKKLGYQTSEEKGGLLLMRLML